MTRKLAYMQELRERVRELHAQGLPEREITLRVLGKENLMALFSGGDFTRRNLVRALLPGWPGPTPLSD
jgi:hypothetical protein